MFNKTKTVIFLTKTSIKAGKVSLFPTKKVKKVIQENWTGQTIQSTLEKIKKKFGKNDMRVVLSKDMSYVVRFKVSGGSESDRREQILKKVTETIPENLEKNDWDDVTLPSGDVVVVAPVKGQFDKFRKAIKATGIEIEAIEPEQLSITRHSDPMIGIALKKDLTDDSKSLKLNI